MRSPTHLLPWSVLLLIGPGPAGAQTPAETPASKAAPAGASLLIRARRDATVPVGHHQLTGPAGAQPGDSARLHLARFSARTACPPTTSRRPRSRRAGRQRRDDRSYPTAHQRHRGRRQRREGAAPRRAARRDFRPPAAVGRRPGRRLPPRGKRRAGGRALSPLRHRGAGVALTPAAGDPASRTQRFATAPAPR